MSDELERLRRYERGMAAVLRAADPPAALAALVRSLGPGTALAEQVAAIDPEGLRIAALLIARLRFERLVQGSTIASRWFEEDPGAFARAFRLYHAEVPATAHFPADEAALFERWARSRE